MHRIESEEMESYRFQRMQLTAEMESMARPLESLAAAAMATSMGTVVVLMAREDLAMARGTVCTKALPEAMSSETVNRYIIFTDWVGKNKKYP
jgi:hypothetical protein